MQYDNAPAILREYLMYLSVVNGKSQKTIYEYHLDLVNYLKFIKKSKNSLKEELDEIIITDVDIDFIKTITLEDTYEYLKRINFYKMHVFKYSPRKGTKAAEMKNQIPGDIKEIRSKRLLELSDENEIRYLDSYIGKEVEVLIEEEVMGYYVGHTSNFIKVKVKSSNVIERNSIIKVKVEKAYDSYVIAKEEL